ncbi:glycosyltransferase [Pandoraea sp. NPDC090278]|uniref:glycosyltransferase n=1 Tax=Pandoraea sp. NPDC090278 TaxID=3364391 RepID=UPI00383A32D2
MTDITHLYFGTAGSAGLYTHRIYKALEGEFAQEALVNHYFPFPYGRKIFFKYTELTGPNKLKKSKYLRFFVRYLELIYGLIASLFIIATNKTRIVNYNLISEHFSEYLFLLVVKKVLRRKLMLTLHDVIPFESQHVNVTPRHRIKQMIIDLADTILIHNKNSADDFKSSFRFDGPISQHGFPIMDPVSMRKPAVGARAADATSRGVTFLFVGHPRSEKGLDILAKAWSIFAQSEAFDGTTARLVVASNLTQNHAAMSLLSGVPGVSVIAEFISDARYFDLIEDADYVVLPYKRGTNSGIPGTTFALGTGLICSDIAMFRSNTLIPETSFFKSEDPEALARKMAAAVLAPAEQYRPSTQALAQYNSAFDTEVKALYRKLLTGSQ